LKFNELQVWEIHSDLEGSLGFACFSPFLSLFFSVSSSNIFFLFFFASYWIFQSF